ncbi:cytochrome d ubiquinol oxidase subunit II [Nonomuraea cavernae]|uniref:Cytochrome c oxidase assembly protein n=1 Tax=Nonomuraea cavernae TaxID=2045107 RepID=A0A918DEB7_9ACTN|nr:cytochrome d ubiquinol oxidase subunit II [Nonomuraea cavernae]MCA2183646.1 cytochrome d ubiquinol oxidase subunit II [Nonomuraea cavernae]GGO60928.1 cytochrome c oxidase assembly protein [Nonomuraea cavernae]
MELTTVWFVAIAVLWLGYFVLEGFDYGVGVLLPVVGRNDAERQTMLNTIGPVWDANEVWLITAGGATFAAFPEWYASLFSGFYIPLLLILLALIVRGVGIEYRTKHDDKRWERRWDAAIVVGSFVPALLWGVAFANLVRGVKLDSRHEYVGTFWDLLNPYALLGGLATLTLSVTHGAVFLALKTKGDISRRAAAVGLKAGAVAAVAGAAFLVWTQLTRGDLVTWILGAVVALSFVLGLGALARRRQGWAFLLSAVAIGMTVIWLFTVMYPNVMPSTINPAYSLTVENAAATDKTLGIMTWVAVFFLPLVLIYQGWTYWVFRHRISTS